MPFFLVTIASLLFLGFLYLKLDGIYDHHILVYVFTLIQTVMRYLWFIGFVLLIVSGLSRHRGKKSRSSRRFFK